MNPDQEQPLKLFQNQLWCEDEVVFRTSLKRGDDGFFLALTIAKALSLSNKLSRVEVLHFDKAWEVYSFSIVDEKLPMFQIHDSEHKKFNQDTLLYFYEQLDGRTVSDPDLLNHWLRAWSGSASELFEMIQACQSLPILASLVERGGNPLLAIKL